MESKINQSVQKMMTHVGATQIAVTDSKGIQIISKGNLDPRISSAASQIFSDAKNMCPSAKYENPIVVLHSANNGRLTIVNNHGETVVLHNK